jgi:hypothetical protein
MIRPARLLVVLSLCVFVMGSFGPGNTIILQFSDRNGTGVFGDLLRRNELYAKLHGYSYRLHTTQTYAKHMHPSFEKLYLVQRALKEGFSVVVWIDDDAFVHHLHLRIEDRFIRPQEFQDKHFVVGQEVGHGVNTGVFIVRNSKWSRNLFNVWVNDRQYCTQQFREIQDREESIYEQDCLFQIVSQTRLRESENPELWYTDTSFIEHTAFVPISSFGCAPWAIVSPWSLCYNIVWCDIFVTEKVWCRNPFFYHNIGGKGELPAFWKRFLLYEREGPSTPARRAALKQAGGLLADTMYWELSSLKTVLVLCLYLLRKYASNRHQGNGELWQRVGAETPLLQSWWLKDEEAGAVEKRKQRSIFEYAALMVSLVSFIWNLLLGIDEARLDVVVNSGCWIAFVCGGLSIWMHRELVLSVLFLSQIGNLVFCGEHYISLHNFWIEMGFALVLLLSRLVWACWCVTRIIRPYIFGGRAVFPTSTKALNKSKYALWCLISSVYLCFSSLSYACVHLRVTILLSPELRGLQM